VWALTDDQDLTLGGGDPMKQTQEMIQLKGVTLNQWRIHTPICSPSRSEFVSGRNFHNIKSDLAVPPRSTVGAGTAHVNASLYTNESFGVYLREQKGYQIALFGKSNFNTFQGFDRWFCGVIVGYGANWQDDESPIKPNMQHRFWAIRQ
jgi:arylsulfatase A-like enzyme